MTMAFNIEFRKAEAAARNVTTDIKMLPDLCTVIARAVLAERERCARIAEAHGAGPTSQSRRSCARDIALKIRNRSE